ncbi:transcriptional regulator [Paraburkholderia graminis]|uniref:helix-turn-helix transcriptional regulator n=1 Tax=Paraburkholderia graminis TaxID=60548 RepID=UPI000DEEE36E|nr:transcriptional regulator [Paraburkholderia graminis]AXF07293.1 transcriptional regulator [Paraburkholderia graminis]
MKNFPHSKPGDVPAVPVLPSIGFSRWTQIAPFVPMGRETWRKLVRAGKAPQPTYFSKTCAAYRNEDVHRFLADPLNYKQDAA